MEKLCSNCKHYKTHYVVNSYNGLQEITGHCLSHNKNGTLKKVGKVCENYEHINKNNIKETKKLKAKELVELINYKLDRMLEYLEN